MKEPDVVSEPKGAEKENVFARSPFRSGYFLVATAVCAGCIFYALFIACTHWQQLSSASTFLLFFVAISIWIQWSVARRYHERIRELCREEKITVVESSALHVALESAARLTNSLLFYSAGAIWVLVIAFFSHHR